MPVAQLLMGSLGGSGGGSGGGIGQSTANMASGLLSGAVGFFQRKKAKKELSNLNRPEYEIPNEILQNQKRAELAANEGLPSQQYNQGMQNIQRQQNRALTAAGSRRGALMALPAIQQQANDSLLGLDVKDAQARMANQQQLYGINNQVAGLRDKAFEINKMQPYQQKFDYYNQLLGAGNSNLLAGADKLLTGGGMAADSALSGNLSGSKKTKKATSDPYANWDYNSFINGD